jgi:hypothetical protein
MLDAGCSMIALVYMLQSVMGGMNFAGMRDMLPAPEDEDMPDTDV